MACLGASHRVTAPEAVRAAGLAAEAEHNRSLKASYLQQPRCLICMRDGEEARAYRERDFIEKDLPDECRSCHTRVSQLAVCWTGGLMTEIRRRVYHGLMKAGNAFYNRTTHIEGGVDPGLFKAMCSSVRGLVRYEDISRDNWLGTGQFALRYAFISYEAVEAFLDLLELQKAGVKGPPLFANLPAFVPATHDDDLCICTQVS